MKSYDVVVVGAGPAGYTAAIRCAQLGLKTACVDRWLTPTGKPALGGTCLNAGCIPSKALLESSEEYSRLQQHAAAHGILIEGLTLDLAAMHKRKNKIVRALTGGIASLFKKNAITWLPGNACLTGDMQVEVRPLEEGKDPETVHAGSIIIATGSVPQPLAAAPVDDDRIVDSTGAMNFSEVPKRLVVIGAGVIGLEMGSVWSRLGSEVTLLEAQEQFLPPLDRELAALALKEFTRQGLAIQLGARVTGTHATKTQVRVTYKDAGGNEQEIKADRLVVAVGRSPVTGGDLCHQESGILLDERGYIEVDEYCRTEVTGVYAIGDAVRGPMLAHKGADEGIAVAESIAGQARKIDHGRVPWVIYTAPELAWVGASEAELTARGIDYKVGTFPMRANGRARAMEQTAGLVKVISDSHSDTLLGVHIMGAVASELINEAVVAMEFGASAEDLARVCHAHPTLSEALREAALASDGRAIHI